jgi:hypothetical protein
LTVFSNQTLRLIIVVALLAHAIAHVIALGALVAQSQGGLSASQITVRAWLLPSLSADTAAMVVIPLWLISSLGLLLAALSFWGILVPPHLWRQLAVGSALVSVLGIALVAGAWPGSANLPRSILNTSVALAMNVVIFGTQLWLRWPALALFGR